MRPTAQWTPLEGLRQYGLVLLRKMGYIALGWVIVYFLSQPFRQPGEHINILVLFAPLIGGLAGVTIGWYLAENAAEDSPLTGMPLWTILTLAAWSTLWAVEGILYFFRHWSIEFGGWMLLSAAMILALAAAVWRSSADQ